MSFLNKQSHGAHYLKSWQTDQLSVLSISFPELLVFCDTFFLCKCALITLYILLFKEEEHCSVYMLEAKPNIEILRPLYIRLIMIFVYTQVVVRTIDSTTICNVHDLGNMASNVDLFPVLTGVRVWRIIQLLIVTIVYLNRLFKQLD